MVGGYPHPLPATPETSARRGHDGVDEQVDEEFKLDLHVERDALRDWQEGTVDRVRRPQLTGEEG
jgi:hypothetical protein